MSSAPVQNLSPEEYLAIERKADHRSEYIHGRMVAMAGASLDHTLIVSNLTRQLGNRLSARGCSVLPQDLRVKVVETGLYTYPDVSVVCGEPQLEDGHRDTLLNPTIVFEVLSPSTEAYDRGAKFAHYRRLVSMQAYVLVSQSEARVESFIRAGANWEIEDSTGIEGTLKLATLGCDLPLLEIYEGVSFGEPSRSP